MAFESPQFNNPLPEKKKTFKQRMQRIAALGAVALALGSEACSPKESEAEKMSGPGGGSAPAVSSAEGFKGYGIGTETKDGKVVKTEFGEKKKDGKTSFSGYGISTETEGGDITKSPYGEKDKGKCKFKGGYGIGR